MEAFFFRTTEDWKAAKLPESHCPPLIERKKEEEEGKKEPRGKEEGRRYLRSNVRIQSLFTVRRLLEEEEYGNGWLVGGKEEEMK